MVILHKFKVKLFGILLLQGITEVLKLKGPCRCQGKARYNEIKFLLLRGKLCADCF